MKKIIVFSLCVFIFSSCGIYRKYEPETKIQDTVSIKDIDTTLISAICWQDFFTDPMLQDLINRGLQHNTDLQAAHWRVKEAEAALTAAKLAYLPSFNLAPNGSVNSFDKSKAQWTYSAPINASWEIDIFGRLTNSKRQARALLLQSKDYEQAVRSELIASIANNYYTLLMLDEQYRITLETGEIYKESIRSMKAMKRAGLANDAGVSQMEATYYGIESSLQDLERSIDEVENSLFTILGDMYCTIQRGSLWKQDFSHEVDEGYPLWVVANRPDIRAAEQTLAQAYYATNIARSAFYPSLTLSGTAGWTNNLGSTIVNPGKVILSAVGSLLQPLFNNGQNVANLKIAKARQEEAKLAFEQSILNAGKEVNDAIAQHQKAESKMQWRKKQIDALENAAKQTERLMQNGPTTYLEVLTARQALLQAQLSQVKDRFESIQGMVNLYQALGGGQ